MGNTVVQLRNDTAANWTTNNPTLALGEMGIETDTKRIKVGDGSLGGLSTGTGQENGIITLPAGKTYKITGGFRVAHSSAGNTHFFLYDRTNSEYLSLRVACIALSATSYNTNMSHFTTIITPTSSIDVDIRFYAVVNTNKVFSDSTWLLIEEYGGY